jgi:hypothetical protein
MAAATTEIVVATAIVPIGVAFEGITFLLKTIFKSAKKIREVTRQTRVNSHRCVQLSSRIDTIVGILQEQNFEETISRALKSALIQFAFFLLKCHEFIVQFNSAGLAKRLWNTKDNYDHFEQLHTEFSHHLEGLQLGLTLMNKSNNKSNDEHDRQTDLAEMQDNQLEECKSKLIVPVQSSMVNSAE